MEDSYRFCIISWIYTITLILLLKNSKYNNKNNIYYMSYCSRIMRPADTAKRTGPRTLADKRWAGPIKLLCHVWYQQNQAKIYPRSGKTPKVFAVSGPVSRYISYHGNSVSFHPYFMPKMFSYHSAVDTPQFTGRPPMVEKWVAQIISWLPKLFWLIFNIFKRHLFFIYWHKIACFLFNHAPT